MLNLYSRNEADEILPNLFLGNMFCASNESFLREKRISKILIVGKGLNRSYPLKFEYMEIPVEDEPDENLLPYFEACIEFIDSGLSKKQAVLVHCAAGVSRSSTVVIAYLMRTQNMSFSDALSFVTDKRPIISPNQGFVKQLKLYEEMGCKLDVSNEKYLLLLKEQQEQREQWKKLFLHFSES